jgi:hypothetical protein
MSTALLIFAVIAVCELSVWLPPLWRWHVWTARFWFVVVGLSSLWLFVIEPTFLVGLLVSLAGYRGVNLARVAANRINNTHLERVSRRTAFSILLYEAVTLLFWWLLHRNAVGQSAFWHAVLILQLLAALSLLVTTLRHFRTTRPPKELTPMTDKELPSLTVAIPARNETESLEKCLTSLIASDYPKLEILVLDDCSQNPRTPEIIRGFAHDGVRFIAGEPEPDGWLAKNAAYERLAEEANGELVVFAGADVRFEKQSLRRLVETLLQKKKSMISVMPKNIASPPRVGLSLLAQPMRYAWEFSLPRKMFRRPPVLSTCWIIQRKLLMSSGGFKGVSRSIVPESFFARTAIAHDGYSFMQSDAAMGIACEKDAADQHDTATRTKYPQLHRRPELAVLLTLGELLILIVPITFLLASLATPELHTLAVLSGLTTLVLIVWYSSIVTLVYRKFLLLSLLALPFAVIHDVAVLNYSMLKYEFSVVLWKGRNVCVPVMRVEPRLPVIDPKQ